MQIEYNPGFKISVQIWFALLWRSMLWSLVYSVPLIIVSIVILVFGGIALGFGKEQVMGAAGPIGVILGFMGGLWAFKRVIRGLLGRTFSGYRLLLVKDNQP